MRELLLIAIVASLCLGSLASPRIGLYGYVWFALLRPDMLAWSNRPYSLFLAVATLVGLLRLLHWIPRIFSNPIVLTLLALQVPIWLSAEFAVNPKLSEYPYDLYQKVVGMALLVPVLIRTEEQIKGLVALMAASLGFLGLKYGLFGMLQGGVRFNDGPGGFLADNNCFALAMVMAVPLLWYSRAMIASRPAKIAMTSMTFFTVAAVVMTFSRGAAVALAVVFLSLLTTSKRKLGLLVAVVLIAGPAVYMVRTDYINRLRTLQDPEKEGSANARILYARMALRMAADYPWLGVGFGTYNQMRLVKQYIPDLDDKHIQVLHNTHLQMLTDSGVFAFGLYAMLLSGTLLWLGVSIRRVQRVDPQLANVPRALQGSLLAYTVGSTFLSRVQFDLTYFLIMAAAAWYAIERGCLQRAYEEERAAEDIETRSVSSLELDAESAPAL